MDGARHPHIVSYHQSYFANGAMTILMEFMDGGSLWDVLQRVSTAALAQVDLRLAEFELLVDCGAAC
jgi:serine/threonine protein kinase